MTLNISILPSIKMIILFYLCLLTTHAQSQDYPVAFSGQLLDQYNQPVAQAKIMISRKQNAYSSQYSSSTYTNEHGQFLFIDSNSQRHAHLEHWQQKGLMPTYGQVTTLTQGQYKVYVQKQGYTQQIEVTTEIGPWDGNWYGCRGNCARNYLTFTVCYQCDDGPVTSQTPRGTRQTAGETR